MQSLKNLQLFLDPLVVSIRPNFRVYLVALCLVIFPFSLTIVRFAPLIFIVRRRFILRQYDSALAADTRDLPFLLLFLDGRTQSGVEIVDIPLLGIIGEVELFIFVLQLPNNLLQLRYPRHLTVSFTLNGYLELNLICRDNLGVASLVFSTLQGCLGTG